MSGQIIIHNHVLKQFENILLRQPEYIHVSSCRYHFTLKGILHMEKMGQVLKGNTVSGI